MAPRKSKVTAVPVDAPASESASAEPSTDAQAMSEVISEIKAEPVDEPVVEAKNVPEPVVSKPWRQRKQKVVEPVPEPVEESSGSEPAASVRSEVPRSGATGAGGAGGALNSPRLLSPSCSSALRPPRDDDPRAVPYPNRSMIRAIHSPSKFSLVMTTIPRRRK